MVGIPGWFTAGDDHFGCGHPVDHPTSSVFAAATTGLTLGFFFDINPVAVSILTSGQLIDQRCCRGTRTSDQLGADAVRVDRSRTQPSNGEIGRAHV